MLAVKFGAARGHTLVEMLVVLAIGAILLGLAVQGMRTLAERQRIAAAANDFLLALHTARTEALARGARIDVVSLDGGAGWSGGGAVLADNNGNRLPDPGEEQLLRRVDLPPGLMVSAILTDPQPPAYIAYNGSGRTQTDAASNTPQLGTLTFTLGEQIRRIKINFLGRARLCIPAIETTGC
ncbi:MAG TPA: GspH/FimT family pseudopilin [Burkholderiaceae bacterium]